MTTEEAKALVKRLSLKGHTPNIRLGTDEKPGHLGIFATIEPITNSDTGVEGLMVREPLWIPHYRVVSFIAEVDLINVIWEQVLLPLVEHELQEHFRLDDRRVFEPHPERL